MCFLDGLHMDVPMHNEGIDINSEVVNTNVAGDLEDPEGHMYSPIPVSTLFIFPQL